MQPWASPIYVENLEIDNSLKWVTFNLVSGQITSRALAIAITIGIIADIFLHSFCIWGFIVDTDGYKFVK